VTGHEAHVAALVAELPAVRLVILLRNLSQHETMPCCSDCEQVWKTGMSVVLAVNLAAFAASRLRLVQVFCGNPHTDLILLVCHVDAGDAAVWPHQS
jgi:hypothetical protein